MSFFGKSPSLDRVRFTPLSADPVNPQEGDEFYSDGTARPEGKWVYTNSAWVQVGSASSAAGLIQGDNSSLEGSVGSWIAYANTASTQPSNGTGGTPTTTVTRSTSSPLNGDASLLITKDAANRQGEGGSLTIDVDPKFRGQPVSITFSYSASSNFDYGTYLNPADPSDVLVYLYDVTNSTLIQPNPIFLDGSGYYAGTIQIHSACTSIRAILHIATTNTLAWTFKADDFTLDLAVNTTSSNLSNLVSFTPTGSWNVNTTYSGRFSQIGEFLYLDYYLTTTGAPNATSLTLNLPPGFVINASKLADSVPTTATYLDGSGGILDAPAVSTFVDVKCRYETNTSINVVVATTGLAAQGSLVTNTVPITWGSGDALWLQLKVPVVGYSSDYSHPAQIGLNARSVFSAHTSTTAATTATPFEFSTISEQAGLSYNAGVVTVLSPGDYYVAGRVYANASWTLRVFVNRNGAGAAVEASGVSGSSSSLSFVGYLVRGLGYGDTIELRPDTNVTASLGAAVNTFQIHKVSNVSQPYAPRVAYLKDLKSSGSAGGTATSGSYLTRVLNTVEGDQSFVSLSSNQFTLQPGTYNVEAAAPFYDSNSSKIKIRNITDSSDVVLGSTTFSGISSDNAMVESTLFGTFSISSTKTFELQYRVQTTRATDGLGIASSFGDSEVYAQVKLTKVL